MLFQRSLDELEKLVNSIREKREDDRKKLRSEVIPQTELGNDSPSQQIAQNSISSTVINSTTTNVIQQESSVASTVTTTTQELPTNVISTTNGKTLKKRDRESSRESPTIKHHRSRRRRSSTRSRLAISFRISTAIFRFLLVDLHRLVHKNERKLRIEVVRDPGR